MPQITVKVIACKTAAEPPEHAILMNLPNSLHWYEICNQSLKICLQNLSVPRTDVNEHRQKFHAILHHSQLTDDECLGYLKEFKLIEAFRFNYTDPQIVSHTFEMWNPQP